MDVDPPPPIPDFDMKLNGCQILQPAHVQLHNACAYMAIALFLSYALRRRFACLRPPYEPSPGMMLVHPYEWQRQLVGRGLGATNVGLLLYDALHFIGVPLRNGGRLKITHYDHIKDIEADGSLSIPKVLEWLAIHGCIIGVFKVYENYDRQPKVPYVVVAEAKHLAEHAVVILGYRMVVEGGELSHLVPPGSYYIIQDSHAISGINPMGINLADCSHFVEGYVAYPDFEFSNL